MVLTVTSSKKIRLLSHREVFFGGFFFGISGKSKQREAWVVLDTRGSRNTVHLADGSQGLSTEFLNGVPLGISGSSCRTLSSVLGYLAFRALPANSQFFPFR